MAMLEILAENIHILLKWKNMKKYELAEKANISISFLSDISNLKANPAIGTVEKIAEALGVPLFQMFLPFGKTYTELKYMDQSEKVYVFALVTRQESFSIKKISERN